MLLHKATSLLIGLVYLALAGASASAQEKPPRPADSNSEVSSDWFRAISENISQREYHFSQDGDTWIAPNRAHRLRVHANESGLHIEPRTAGWSVSLSLRAIGREGALEPTRAFQTAADGQRLELHHPNVVEWYVNNDAGLQQGFTLDSAPAGDPSQPVILEMQVSGEAQVRSGAGRDGLAFVAGDREVLHYGALHVYDDKDPAPLRRCRRRLSGRRRSADDLARLVGVGAVCLLGTRGLSSHGRRCRR